MPAPPAALTFALFSTRALPPRMHSTIVPEIVLGSGRSQRGSCRLAASTTGAPLTWPAIDRPPTDGVSAPARSVRLLANRRSVVLAATLITQGALAGAPIVPGSGPPLPAATATNTPAREGSRDPRRPTLLYGAAPADRAA